MECLWSELTQAVTKALQTELGHLVEKKWISQEKGPKKRSIMSFLGKKINATNYGGGGASLLLPSYVLLFLKAFWFF